MKHSPALRAKARSRTGDGVEGKTVVGFPVRSHTRAVPSAPTVINNRPSGVNAAAYAAPSHSPGRFGGVADCPVAASNSLVLQNPGTATRRPSGENAADLAEPLFVSQVATG